MFPGGKCGRCVGLTTLPPSCADCLEIWEPQPTGNLRAYPGPVMGLLKVAVHNTLLLYTEQEQKIIRDCSTGENVSDRRPIAIFRVEMCFFPDSGEDLPLNRLYLHKNTPEVRYLESSLKSQYIYEFLRNKRNTELSADLLRSR